MADPLVGNVNIPDYLKVALNKAAGTVNDTFTDVADIMTRASSNTATEGAAIQDSARAQSDIDRLTISRKLLLESRNKQQTAEFGTNPEASSYVLSAMAHNIITLHSELKQRDKGLQEKLDTKFSDDPVGWITNQFTIPGDVVAFAHKAEELKRTDDVMAGLLARSKDVVALNNAIDAGTSLEVANALEKKNMADATVKVQQTNQKLLEMNLTGVNIRRAASLDQAHLMISAQAAEAKQQELQLQRDAAGRAERSLQLQEEMRNFALDEKLQKKETEALLQAKLNNVTAITGDNPISVRQYFAMGQQSRAKYDTLMTDPDIEEQRLGYNTAVALDKANSFNFTLTPGMNYVRDKLVKMSSTVAASIPKDQTPFEKLKPAEQLAKVQEALEKKVREERHAIPVEGGIYSPPSLAKVLDIPLVSSLSITKDLTPLITQDKTTPTDPNLIFTTAVAKIQRGESNPATMAAEMQLMFQAAAMDNNTQRAYKRLVLPMITEKDGFKMTVYTGKSWKGNEILDMTNKAQLENALMRRVASAKQEELANQLGYGNAGTGVAK